MTDAEPRRGEIWLVSLGAARSGEPGKNRPAVIVSLDDLQTGAADDLFVVVPISSSRGASALRPEILPTAGIDRPSRAIPRAVRAVSRSRLLRCAGQVAPTKLTEIERALALILGLRPGM